MAIVRECTGHTCHSQHHVLWYLFRQPTTTVLLELTYEFYIQERKKTCFSRSREDVQSSRSICQRAPTISEYGHQPNSLARLSSLQSEGAQHHCVVFTEKKKERKKKKKRYLCVCVWVCVRARPRPSVCVRACVPACLRVCRCVCECVCV